MAWRTHIIVYTSEMVIMWRHDCAGRAAGLSLQGLAQKVEGVPALLESSSSSDQCPKGILVPTICRARRTWCQDWQEAASCRFSASSVAPPEKSLRDAPLARDSIPWTTVVSKPLVSIVCACTPAGAAMSQRPCFSSNGYHIRTLT